MRQEEKKDNRGRDGRGEGGEKKSRWRGNRVGNGGHTGNGEAREKSKRGKKRFGEVKASDEDGRKEERRMAKKL